MTKFGFFSSFRLWKIPGVDRRNTRSIQYSLGKSDPFAIPTGPPPSAGPVQSAASDRIGATFQTATVFVGRGTRRTRETFEFDVDTNQNLVPKSSLQMQAIAPRPDPGTHRTNATGPTDSSPSVGPRRSVLLWKRFLSTNDPSDKQPSWESFWRIYSAKFLFRPMELWNLRPDRRK